MEKVIVVRFTSTDKDFNAESLTDVINAGAKSKGAPKFAFDVKPKAELADKAAA